MKPFEDELLLVCCLIWSLQSLGYWRHAREHKGFWGGVEIGYRVLCRNTLEFIYYHVFLKKKWRHFFYIKQKFLLNQTCLQDANLEISLQNNMCIFLYKFHIVHFDYIINPNSSHIYFPPSITHPSKFEFSFSSSFYFPFSIKSSLCCLAILRCRAFSGVAIAYKKSIHDMMICHVKASSISQQLSPVNSFTGSSRIPCPLPFIHPDLCLASTCASLGHAAPVVWGLYM